MMKVLFFLVFQLAVSYTTFSQLQGSRYKDDVFAGSDTITHVYGNNIDYQQKHDTLLADYYFPKEDTAKNRAAIFFVHGGGFRSGHRNDAAITELCDKLTKKGYIAISIDYRVGVNSDSGTELCAAVIRAIQDLNAAIRFTKANAADMGIDTNLLFISGASAGAIAVLHKAFMKPDSMAQKLGISNAIDIEGNTNQLPNSSNVAAAYALWGALIDTSWIVNGDIPVGCVHSIADSTVPFISGYSKRNGNLMLYGSYSVNQRAINQGIFTTIHGYNSGRHDLGLKVAPFKDTTVQLMCDFFYEVIATQLGQKNPGARLKNISEQPGEQIVACSAEGSLQVSTKNEGNRNKPSKYRLSAH